MYIQILYMQELTQIPSKIQNPDKRLIVNSMRLANTFYESLAIVFKTFDISAEQFNVLRILRGQQGKPANMCLIQERMISKTSNTTRLVDKLLAKELVTRTVCEYNRRKIEVCITEKGLELLSQIDPILSAKEARLLTELTDTEKEQFATQIEHILNHINT